MKCVSCGAPIGGKTVCPKCGAAQPDPTDAVIGKIKGKCTMTNLLVVLVLLTVLVVAGAIFGALFKPAPAFGYRTGDTVVFWQGEDSVLATRGGKTVSEGDDGFAVFYAGDLSLGAYIKDGMLMLADDAGVTVTPLAAEKVLSVSDDGTAVFCRDADGRVLQYTTLTKRARTVAEQTATAYVDVLVPSPDGKCAVYSTLMFADADGDELIGRKMYFFDGTESVYIGRGAVPLSTVNGGGCIYAACDGVLYRYTKDNDEREVLGGIGGFSVLTNRDGTEILFAGEDGKWRLASPGRETVSLGVRDAEILAPEGCGKMTFDAGLLAVIRYDCSHFGDMLFRTETAVCRLGDEGLAEWFPAAAGNGVLRTEDGQYVFTAEDGVLRRRAADGSGDAFVVAEQISLYAVSPDGKTVYYTDAEKTLYVRVFDKEPRRLADDVSRLFRGADGTFWFLVDDVLYLSGNARSKKPVLSGVADVTLTDGGTVYAVTSDGLYAGSGTGVRLLAEGKFVRLPW